MLRGLVCFAFLLLLVSCKIAMDKNNVFAALKTIYCRSDRLDVLGMINNGTIISPTVNKTLVVVLSSTRSKNITWNNFRTRFLDILDADLALAVSTKPENDSAFDGFRHHANYIWEIDDPPRNDYGYFYNEVSMRCFNHTFDEHYASVVGQVNGKSSGWLGCIHGTNQRACSGQIIFFRWFALQNILNDRLFEIYDKVVITRSDFLWLGEHCDISAIKRGQVGVPQHYDYGGLYDRHHVFTMYDAIDALDLLDAVIEREDPEEQKQWLIEKEFDSLSGNLESAMMCWCVVTTITLLSFKFNFPALFIYQLYTIFLNYSISK